jgi:hypothetical protein
MKYIGCLAIVAAGLAGSTAGQAQVRAVSGFHSVSDAGSFAVHIKTGGTEGVKIEGADAATAAMIETVVESGSLEIRWKRGAEHEHQRGKVDVYVSAKSLSGLACSGSGSMDVDGVVNGGHVAVTLSGSGSIASSVDAGNLEVTISGSGAVKLRGKSGVANIRISGSGRLNAESLSADAADIGISGSGDTYITVNKTLSARLVGSGNVYYSGSGTLGSVKTIGSGRVSRRNNS